jgi:purine-binding chemotaxis protein CheW
MSASFSRARLMEQGLALGAYLEELLNDATPVAATVAAGAATQLSQAGASDPVAAPATQSYEPAPARDRLQVRVFEVAGLSLAVPVARVKEVVTSQSRYTPLSDPVPLLLGVLASAAGESRVVDTARLILPQDRSMQAGENPGRQVGPFVVLDAGHWALACARIGAVIELQDSDVRWRTAAGKRPWLAGTVMKQMCALLDIDALIGLLDDRMAR